MVIQVSHNVTNCIGLDIAVIVQVEFLLKSMGFCGIILIAQVHLHSILPLIHIRNSKWRLKSLLPLCNTATVLQSPLQSTNAHMHSYTHVLFLPSSHAMSLCFLSVILSQYPSPHFQRCTSVPLAVFLLYGSERLKTALVRPKLGRLLMGRKFQ